jgi:hypothetical protein
MCYLFIHLTLYLLVCSQLQCTPRTIYTTAAGSNCARRQGFPYSVREILKARLLVFVGLEGICATLIWSLLRLSPAIGFCYRERQTVCVCTAFLALTLLKHVAARAFVIIASLHSQDDYDVVYETPVRTNKALRFAQPPASTHGRVPGAGVGSLASSIWTI